jgi:hypothetical protein
MPGVVVMARLVGERQYVVERPMVVQPSDDLATPDPHPEFGVA